MYSVLNEIETKMLEIVNKYKNIPKFEIIIDELLGEFDYYELFEEKEGIYEFYDILIINQEKIKDSFFSGKDVYIKR